MKKVKHILRAGMLIGALFTFAACDKSDDNKWQEENETTFEKIGKELVVLPRNQVIYSTNPVKDTVIYVEVKPEEVITLSSGVKYRILHKSENTLKPYFTSVVKVNYEGRRINGVVFDSTYGPDTNGPLKTLVRGSSINGIIRGWSEILPEMCVGDRFEVYIPWQLGYGDTDSGTISAYSALVFIMELVEICEL